VFSSKARFTPTDATRRRTHRLIRSRVGQCDTGLKLRPIQSITNSYFACAMYTIITADGNLNNW